MAENSALPVLPLAGRRHIILAVSGGSDSTALLHLAVRQAVELGDPPKLTAVTIDHRLRSGSAAEARSVETLCASLGIAHQTLVWDGPKPSSAVQDAARNARRRLLAAAAGKAGADAVFTGHTLDDQLETVAMRQLRGTGHGLAGIAPVSFVFDDSGSGEPVPFMRPLLDTGRAELRQFLRSNGAGWIDDPSNENTAFERVIVRKELAASGQQLLAELIALQHSKAKERILSAKRAAGMIEANTFWTAPGLTRIDHGFAAGRSHADSIPALRILQAFASASPVLADEGHARSVLEAAAVHSGSSLPAAKFGKGGTLAELRKQGIYMLQEQRRGKPNSAPFAGRYRLTGTEPGEKPPLPRKDPVPAPASLIRKALTAEPVFDCPNAGATSCAEAYRGGRRLRLLINPWPDLVPSFDLPAYNALAKVAGATQINLPLL